MALFPFFRLPDPKFGSGQLVAVRPTVERGTPLYLLIERRAWEMLPPQKGRQWVYQGRFFYVACDKLRCLNPALLGNGKVKEVDLESILE